MTQVPWSVLDPTRVERIAGVMLGREPPAATRLRPGRGDGGIDVFVPADDGRVDVYQIKSFATALTSSQRAQIEHSLHRVANNPRVEVCDWYLTLPLNPTPNDVDWLDELCRDVVFAHHWFGYDQLEALAARYQDVVDYYVSDGRARLERTIEQLRGLSGLSGLSPTEADTTLTPQDLIDPLTSVHALLNRDDPHYRYDFHVTGHPTAPRTQLPASLVASWSLRSTDTIITFDIHARYRHATEDQPIPITFTIDTGRLEGPAAEEWDRMLRYGTPATVEAPAVAGAAIGLPIGDALGEDVAMIRLGPGTPPGAGPYQLRLRAIDPDEHTVAEITLDMRPVTRGITGGWRVSGVAPHDAFTLEVVGDTVPTPDTGVPMRLSINIGELTGRPPAGLRPGIDFLAALRHPNRLQFLPPHGPPVGPPLDVPEPDAPITDALADLIAALADVQEHAAAHLLTPDIDDLDQHAVAAIHRAARLVRGETLHSTWSEQPISIPADADVAVDGPTQVHLGGDYTLQIGDQTVVLSPVTTVLLAATLTRTGETSETVELMAHPALGNTTRLTYLQSIDDTPIHDATPIETDEN